MWITPRNRREWQMPNLRLTRPQTDARMVNGDVFCILEIPRSSAFTPWHLGMHDSPYSVHINTRIVYQTGHEYTPPPLSNPCPVIVLYQIAISPHKLAHRKSLPICCMEVDSCNIDRYTDQPDNFPVIPQSFQENPPAYLKLDHDRFLSNPFLFTIHRTIWHYIL